VIFKKFNKYIPFIIDVDIFIKSIIIILILFTVFAFIFLPKCIYKNSEFFLDKNFLKVKSGIILPTVTLVRIKNIYKFSIKKRLIGRLFEISIVTIETSAGNIKIDFLNDKKSQFLLNNLQSIIKNYEG
jgi:membrane protein YdbS with pleckstrin-like domain